MTILWHSEPPPKENTCLCGVNNVCTCILQNDHEEEEEVPGDYNWP